MDTVFDFLKLNKDAISVIVSVGTLFCGIFTLAYVKSGLNTWRSTLIGTSQYKATKDFIAVLYELSDAVKILRRKEKYINDTFEEKKVPVEIKNKEWMYYYFRLANFEIFFEKINQTYISLQIEFDDKYNYFFENIKLKNNCINENFYYLSMIYKTDYEINLKEQFDGKEKKVAVLIDNSPDNFGEEYQQLIKSFIYNLRPVINKHSNFHCLYKSFVSFVFWLKNNL